MNLENHKKKKVLVIVDPQNDFISGSLSVPGAKEAMDNLIEHITKHSDDYQQIIVTQDYHPENHCSFKSNGGIWPEHCVKETEGSEIYGPLTNVLINFPNYTVFQKGCLPDKEEYSAFEDILKNPFKSRVIENFKDSKISVDFAGIAGDYCVKESLNDMMKYLPNLEYNLLENCIASIDGGKTIKKLKEVLKTVNKCAQYGPVIKHFTDNDLYTFTCQYFALMNFPRAEIVYEFFDRNNTVYPLGFGKALYNNLQNMKDVVITDEEIEFMKRKIDFLPDWYYTFLRGFRFNPKEVDVKQDEEGHLRIIITASWFSGIFWEMPILSTISELMHFLKGEFDIYNQNQEYLYAYEKGKKAIMNGLYLADMGTRRRFSFKHQDNVVCALKDAQTMLSKDYLGKITGTSNVYFAMKYDMTPIGTMSHQVISFIEGTMSNPFEVNYLTMDLWSKTFEGNCGIYLNDCFTSKTFFNSLSLRQAKLWDGIRIDSGDNIVEAEKMINKYWTFDIDPRHKTVCFSNGLNIDEAIDIHNKVSPYVRDTYGIGTYLTCDLTIPVKPMNIVIKAVAGRITEKREYHKLIKVSNDSGKSVGDADKCAYVRKIIGHV